jgi:hypothetical protein
LPYFKALRIVDVEHSDSSAADLGAPCKHYTLPFEMPFPDLTARIEEANNFPCQWVSTAQVRAFVKVASMATPAPIVNGIRSTVLLGDNVFCMENGDCGSAIGKMTILTPLTSPFTDKLAKGPLHPVSAVRLSKVRACA